MIYCQVKFLFLELEQLRKKLLFPSPIGSFIESSIILWIAEKKFTIEQLHFGLIRVVSPILVVPQLRVVQ